MPKFDDEPPTQPDLPRYRCPACRNEEGKPTGTVLVTKEKLDGRHYSKRETCPACNGRLVVTRKELATWRARSR